MTATSITMETAVASSGMRKAFVPKIPISVPFFARWKHPFPAIIRRISHNYGVMNGL